MRGMKKNQLASGLQTKEPQGTKQRPFLCPVWKIWWMHGLLHSLFCHPTPFNRFRMLQDIVLQDGPWIKLRSDHAHNLAAVSGVNCEPKCCTKLNIVSCLSCCKGAVICMTRDDFRLQNYNISSLFQYHSQFIKLRSSPCHFTSVSLLVGPCLSFVIEPCPSQRFSSFSSSCVTSPKQVPSSCTHDIQPLRLCCTSATPRTSLLFGSALLTPVS